MGRVDRVTSFSQFPEVYETHGMQQRRLPGFPDREYALLQMQNPTSLKAESNAAKISFFRAGEVNCGECGMFHSNRHFSGFQFPLNSINQLINLWGKRKNAVPVIIVIVPLGIQFVQFTSLLLNPSESI